MAKKGTNIDVEISELALRRVREGLESAIDDAVQTKDLQRLSANLQSIILLRTKRGYYLDGEGGKEIRHYRSQAWIRQRESKGLTTSHVTLFYGEGQLLESMVARGKMVLGKPTVQVGYFEGLSESKALEIAKYMNKQGIGSNKVKYPYVGLTKKERKKAIDFLRKRVAKNIKSNL